MSVTAKSIILDIDDNWGDDNYLGLRSMELKLNTVLQELDDADISATYGTENNSTVEISNIFNTGLSKTGTVVDTGWQSASGENESQRIICVFTSTVTFNEITINNYHHEGTLTTRGIENVKIIVSTDTITDTTFEAAVANSSEIYDSTFDQHTASDASDDQDLVLTLPGIEGNAAITYAAVEISATGSIDLEGSSAITFPILGLAATGKLVGGEADINWVMPSVDSAGGSCQGEIAVTFPVLTAAATGVCTGGTGDVTFPSIVIHADDDNTEGEVAFPAIIVAASGSALGGNGEIEWGVLDADAVGQSERLGEAESFFPILRVSGTGTISILGNGAIATLKAVTSASGFLGLGGNSSLQFPIMEVTSITGGTLLGNAAIPWVALELYGEGEALAQTDTILRHSRY